MGGRLAGVGMGLWQLTWTGRFFCSSDLPCYMTVEEMKSLMRLPDIIASARQNVSTVEISARRGTGLAAVLRWLQDTHRADG